MFPVFRPSLPVASEIAPFMEMIDHAHWYTNYGPLVQEFEARLAQMCGVRAGSIVTCCNGTAALIQAIQAFVVDDASQPRYCIIPSWTFVATPAAVTAAGLVPYFADVGEKSWAIEADEIRELVKRLEREGKKVACVMPVVPFGAPIDYVAWEDFRDQTGIPVILDAAAAFDIHCVGSPAHAAHSLPAIISMHATKAFGVGEGAFIISADVDKARRIRAWGNFGFSDSRTAMVPGTNTKMPELTAAMGLALVNRWGQARQQWSALTEVFLCLAKQQRGIEVVPVMSNNWISSYGLIRLCDPTIDIASVVAELSARGIETRQWWTSCHLQPAFQQCLHTRLPNTERLSKSVIGLPFWLGVQADDLGRIFGVLGDTLAGMGSGGVNEATA